MKYFKTHFVVCQRISGIIESSFFFSFTIKSEVNDMSFGNNLRTLIEERNMTQKELAQQMNIAPSTIGSYVQNTREPDFATLKLLAGYFDVSIDYLLDYSSGEIENHQEDEMLRIFRSLTEEQKNICIEQCRVFVCMNHKKKTKKRKLSS